MSTRAIYEFYGKNEQKILSIYIHHDGYPDGAAAYLNNALNKVPQYLESDYGVYYAHEFVANFIRTNERAEITEGFEEHSDVEYLYKIDILSKKITTWAVNWNKVRASGKCRYEIEDQFEFWDTIEICSISDFLEKHNKFINVCSDEEDGN